MPKGVFEPKLVTMRCTRCGNPFEYIRYSRRRLYCDPCKLLEIRECAKVNNHAHYVNVTKPARQARMAAAKEERDGRV